GYLRAVCGQPPDPGPAYHGYRPSHEHDRGVADGIRAQRGAPIEPQDLAVCDHRLRPAIHQRGTTPMTSSVVRGASCVGLVLALACQARVRDGGTDARQFKDTRALSYVDKQIASDPR